MATRTLSLVEMTESQAGKYITHNTALHQMDAWTSVLSRTNSGPPGSPEPSEGDAYIVDSATGDWSGFTVGDLVVYYQNSAGTATWVGVSPVVGPQVYVEDESSYVQWDSSASEWKVVGAISSVTVVPAASPLLYTVSLSDNNAILVFDDAYSVAIPENATTALPVGFQVTIRRDGAGAVTVYGDGSPTSVTFNGSVALSSQYDSITLVKRDTDTWLSF